MAAHRHQLVDQHPRQWSEGDIVTKLSAGRLLASLTRIRPPISITPARHEGGRSRNCNDFIPETYRLAFVTTHQVGHCISLTHFLRTNAPISCPKRQPSQASCGCSDAEQCVASERLNNRVFRFCSVNQRGPSQYRNPTADSGSAANRRHHAESLSCTIQPPPWLFRLPYASLHAYE